MVTAEPVKLTKKTQYYMGYEIKQYARDPKKWQAPAFDDKNSIEGRITVHNTVAEARAYIQKFVFRTGKKGLFV